MYLTLEVRWFYLGPLPGQIVETLQARSCLPALLPARQDYYLLLEGDPALGIKLREGNVEIKRRLEVLQEIRIGPGAAGRVARWRKWSLPLARDRAAGATPLERLLVPASSWLAVKKERRLQRYRLEGGAQAAPVPLEAAAEPATAETGCEFELSRVWAGGEEWWSVCFEAFGEGPRLGQALLAVAAKVLGPGWPVALEVERSWSYPAWLQRIAAARS